MTERARRLGRKTTTEEIGKGNQMTVLRFQTGGGHLTSPASLWGYKIEEYKCQARRKKRTKDTNKTKGRKGHK